MSKKWYQEYYAKKVVWVSNVIETPLEFCFVSNILGQNSLFQALLSTAYIDKKRLI